MIIRFNKNGVFEGEWRGGTFEGGLFKADTGLMVYGKVDRWM